MGTSGIMTDSLIGLLSFIMGASIAFFGGYVLTTFSNNVLAIVFALLIAVVGFSLMIQGIKRMGGN
jgi:multisubunit Na+/H+ antiporter MnhG subunit